MRFATLRHGGGVTGAVVSGDTVIAVDATDALDAFRRRDTLTEKTRLAFDEVDLAPLSPAPAHVICVGLNYRSHTAELGHPLPDFPALFAKYPSTLTGARDEITLPAVSRLIDGEVELALIIGRTVHREGVDTAGTAIAGFTVANDLSLRDWQHRTSEALQGKVFDQSTPVGPVLVTTDELDVRDAHLELVVDGEVRRAGSTSDMIFNPAELVSYCSMFLTLSPGDLLLTGTPGTVGEGAISLRAGSVVETRIDGIGVATNALVADPLVDNSAHWSRRSDVMGHPSWP